MTMDTATAMQRTKGFKLLDTAPDEVLVAVVGGISPKPVAPPPSAGLLAFMRGVPEPAAGAAPSMGGVGIGVVVVGDIVAGDPEEEDHVPKMQEPELGLTLVIIAAPPKSQLV